MLLSAAPLLGCWLSRGAGPPQKHTSGPRGCTRAPGAAGQPRSHATPALPLAATTCLDDQAARLALHAAASAQGCAAPKRLGADQHGTNTGGRGHSGHSSHRVTPSCHPKGPTRSKEKDSGWERRKERRGRLASAYRSPHVGAHTRTHSGERFSSGTCDVCDLLEIPGEALLLHDD